MSNLDFNDAEEQKITGGLIPEGTVALVVLSLKPGGHGEGGLLKRSNDGGCLMLDCEFTIDGGKYDRRKFWEGAVTEGCTEGHAEAASITRSRVRGMLESARGILPTDSSPEAQAKRRISTYADLNGLRFCAKVGISKGGLKNKEAGPNSERYADKNVLRVALTPADADYVSPGGQTQVAANSSVAVATQPSATGGAVKKPGWAA